MTDPFSSFEKQTGATFDLLKVLANRQYPTLISTKGVIPAQTNYAELLSSGNFLLRFSISVVRPSDRPRIERGTPSPSTLFHLIEILTSRGVKCAVRFQPVIPGHEQFAFDLVRSAGAAGVKHVTFEYLKLPVDDLDSPICKLSGRDGKQLIELYRRSGALRQGRELVLPAGYKVGFLSEISKFGREQGLTVGFGDNEFLPYSDGRSCCNGADLHLRTSNLFESNSASLVRRKKAGEQITFKELSLDWAPSSKVNTYLNSRVRAKAVDGETQWRSYQRQHWRVGAIYSPDFFHGVEFTGFHDDTAMPIFVRVKDKL